jgi:pimeloyl-ACP methyl ester carboxylesterase
VPTAFVNGIDVYFERSGSGRRLLFLNGSGATLESARLLLQPFTQRCDTLAHDQRGLGRTTIPPGPYSMADYASDAAGLLDQVGWATCAVVGVSFGGMVAQELAVTWPERIERLALVCTSPGGEGGASYPLHTLGAKSEAERAALAPLLLDTRFTPEWLADHSSDRMLAEMMQQRRAGNPDPERSRGEAEQLQARADHDVCDRLARVTCPTFIAAGRYDGIAPRSNAEAIAARVPHSKLSVYDGGHAFFAQDPAAIPDVLDFLTAT